MAIKIGAAARLLATVSHSHDGGHRYLTQIGFPVTGAGARTTFATEVFAIQMGVDLIKLLRTVDKNTGVAHTYWRSKVMFMTTDFYTWTISDTLSVMLTVKPNEDMGLAVMMVTVKDVDPRYCSYEALIK